MSSTVINFKARLLVGAGQQGYQTLIPLASEIVFGNSDAKDGVDNGFIFKLDRQPNDPPVTIYLGDVIQFIKTKLDGGDLSQTTPQTQLISAAIPSVTPGGNFNETDQTVVNIYEFTINSSKTEKLFSFNMDVEGAAPHTSFLPLPPELSSWLTIESLSVNFSATKKAAAANP